MNQKGNIDEQLVQAYEQSEYQLIRPIIPIILNESSGDIDTLLIDNNCFNGCLLTAHNPHSQLLSKKENAKRQQSLENWLTEQRYEWFYGKSVDPKGKWPDEQQLLILGMGKKVGGDLARLFEQNAYVYLAIDQPAKLEWVLL